MKNVSMTTWLMNTGEGGGGSVTKWSRQEVSKIFQNPMFRRRGIERLFSILFYLPSFFSPCG
jgi:hypothetical protein